MNSFPSKLRATLLFLSLTASQSRAQNSAAAPPTLDDIVHRMQANLDAYEKTIPSFLVDEHIESSVAQFVMRGPQPPKEQTIAESSFRLNRELDAAGRLAVLKESRDIRTIDGNPANGRSIDASAMISGAFSGGIAFVSDDERHCMTYTLEPIRPGQPIVVSFATFPILLLRPECILHDEATGRIAIDPASMQIERMELDVPHHLVTGVDSKGKEAQTLTHWTLEVDYKPVTLDARTFWLPTTIVSVNKNKDAEWSFRGEYRNYHLLIARSRIVIPGSTQP